MNDVIVYIITFGEFNHGETKFTVGS